MSVVARPPTPPRAEPAAAVSPAERNRTLAWTGTAIGTIWAAVVLISFFAPDNVSGTQQEHVAIAAILTWIWGLIASRTLATAVIHRRRSPGVGATARLLALAVIPIWVVATVVAVFGPVLVTGTDPTRFPIAAVVAPIAALVLTQLVVQLVTAFESDERP